MPCQAELRPRPRYAGWLCRGEGLVTVMWFGPAGDRLPVVVPREALEIVMQREFAMGYEVEDFHGGDHFHLCLTAVEAADYEFASH